MALFRLVDRHQEIPTEAALLILAATIPLFIGLFLSLQAGLFAALFLAIAWYTWREPVNALLLLLIIAPLLPMFKITQTTGTLTIIKDVIILTLFARQVLIPLLTKQLPYRRNPIALPIITLIGWVALNTLRADHLTLGIVRARDIVLYILLFLAVLYLPLTRSLARRALQWVLAAAAIIVSLAAYQWFVAPDSTVLRFDPARQIWIPRISSILAHPSIFGHYLVTLLAVLLAIAITPLKKHWRLAAAIAAIGTLIPLFLTYTRAAWLAALAVVGVTAIITIFQHRALRQTRQLLKKPATWLIAAAVLVTLAAALVRFTPAGTFVRTAIDPTYASNAERLEFAARLIAPMSNTESLVGRGLGDVTSQQLRKVDLTGEDLAAGASRTVQLAKDRTLVDNQYLKSFVELGLIGLLIYAWLYLTLAKSAWKTLRQAATPEHTIIATAFISFLAAFLIQALFIDIWDIFPTNLIFWLLAALVIRAAQPQPELKNAIVRPTRE